MARAVAAALLAGLLAAAASAATPRRGGTLVVARPAVTCLNPFGPCNLVWSDPVLTQVLEGAFEVGPDLVFRPNLVSRVTIGRNPFTLTYHIRPEARWSDGVPVRAADFHFTYRTFARHRTPAVDRRELYAKIRRARVLGPKTLRVELREPFGEWRGFFDLVLPSHALAGADITAIWRDRIDNPKTGRTIGSGPFLVGRLEPGLQLTLVRNPRYWRRHTAHLDRFVFRFPRADPNDPLGPLRRNEVHFTAIPPGTAAPLSADLAAEVRRIPGWRVAMWPALSQELLVLRLGRGGHPALRSRLVRQALAYGIDRVALARRAIPDFGTRARPLHSTVFFAGEGFQRPNWAGYRHDPARARRLLEQAGCRRGADGIYACSGERLRLRVVTTAGAAHREQAVQVVQAQLRSVGVEVEPRYAPPNALFGTILPGGDFDMALFAWLRGPGGGVTPEARCGDVQNWAGYCSRLVMRDVEEADRTVEPARRADVLNAADARIARDVPVLPLFQAVIRAAVRQDVRGFVPGGTQFHFFENSEDWWLAR